MVGDAHVFPGFLTAVLTQLSFQSHRILFSHASAEVRGENTPERGGEMGANAYCVRLLLPPLTLYHRIPTFNDSEQEAL